MIRPNAEDASQRPGHPADPDRPDDGAHGRAVADERPSRRPDGPGRAAVEPRELVTRPAAADASAPPRREEPASEPPRDGGRPPERPAPLPRPVVRRSRWPFPLIWVVPLAAAAFAGKYFYDRHQERGPEIVISFSDGSGLKPGETAVSVHGVPVGQVESVRLSDDHRRAIVRARLSRDEASIARAGTTFWVVRPEISVTNISGLSAVVSGPYIEAAPGDGDATTDFNGLDGAPIMVGKGERLVLHTNRIERLQIDSPVTYRGIQVGVVQDVRLADVADSANVTVFIWDRYTTLVRPGSRFWIVSGTDIKGGLFSGIDVKLGSLRSILTGAVAFATPDTKIGLPVGDGAEFALHEEPQKEWTEWKAVIPLPPEPPAGEAQKPGEGPAKNTVPSVKKG